LSPEVYHGNSISAAAVAAHECGHAVQHATAYGPLVFRSKMVPLVQVTSQWVNWILLAGVIALAMTQNPTILLIGILAMGLTVVFTLLTLPVEFDASNRALSWLSTTNITNSQEYPKAKDALKWAATTYVVAALAAVVQLIQYVMIYLNSRDRG
jgi:Zn-dependent membrane protease YugP